MGIVEALQIMKHVDSRLNSAKIFFIGVFVEKIDKGMKLSEKVKKAIPEAVEKINFLIDKNFIL